MGSTRFLPSLPFLPRSVLSSPPFSFSLLLPSPSHLSSLLPLSSLLSSSPPLSSLLPSSSLFFFCSRASSLSSCPLPFPSNPFAHAYLLVIDRREGTSHLEDRQPQVNHESHPPPPPPPPPAPSPLLIYLFLSFSSSLPSTSASSILATFPSCPLPPALICHLEVREMGGGNGEEQEQGGRGLESF